jgi:tetratricopeptide (TPR) repeat protein
LFVNLRKIYEESDKKCEYIPFLVFVYINMGTCFAMSKMYKEAVKYMNLALDLNSKLNGEKNEINKKIYLNLSDIYAKIERHEESNSYLQKGKKI